jgi:hypothetical protein
VRFFVALTCFLALAPAVQAETGSASAAAQASAVQTYAAKKKSVALAVTLEALSPIAGMGAFYAHDTGRATVLAIVSVVAAGAGVGSAFWLIHLDGQHPTGVDRAFQDAEQGTAITVLATAAVVYLVTRISGLALAPEVTAEFNDNLRQGLGLPPPEPVIPFHALAPGPMFTLRF